MKLCFDCDDTLYDLSYPFKKACHILLNLDDHYDLENMYSTYRSCGDEIFDQIQNGHISIDDSGIYRVKKMCSKYDIEADESVYKEFQNLYKSFQKQIFMSKEFHDYFEHTNAKLAILTNGQDVHQRMKLNALQVFKYFKKENVFTSQELGYAKPDPKAFLKMLSKMDETAAEWYYIGDNYINDMEGAKRIGMQTIHFNRHHGIEGPCSDHIVYTETELIDLLHKL